MSKIVVCLTGKCGAGKNQYQKIICNFFGVEKIFVVSDLLSKDPDAIEYLKRGMMAPERMVNKALKNLNLDDSFCINGLPRNALQSQTVVNMKDNYTIYVVVLNIEDKVAEERMLKRIECNKCGYTTSEYKYLLASPCPKCNEGRLFKRPLSLDQIRSRIAEFESLIMPGLLEIQDDVPVFYMDLPAKASIEKTELFITKALERITKEKSITV